jgi:hypothetical protein
MDMMGIPPAWQVIVSIMPPDTPMSPLSAGSLGRLEPQTPEDLPKIMHWLT